MLSEQSVSVLYIDLEKQKFHIEQSEQLFREYIGGTGLATKLLSKHLLPLENAYDPRQPVIFAIGPLTFVYPMVTKTVAMFKSPQTNELGESHAGLRFGMAMRMAGYDAIVIQGKSAAPIFLHITSKEVVFKNAQPFWGMDCDTTGLYLRQAIPGNGKRSILRIGPAGEKLVSYACGTVDDFRHFGRLGLGGVMGSKNLKAIVIEAAKSFEIQDNKSYKELYEEVYKNITETPLLNKYHDLGTPENIKPLNSIKALPTRNLQSGSFEEVDNISGEAFAENVLSKKVSCSGCPVGCIHIASLKLRFSEQHEYETLSVGYDYELIYALGSLLGIGNQQNILELIYQTELIGADAMQTGVMLAWATEAYAKKLITSDELLCEPEFGKLKPYLEMIGNIASQPNEFYKLMGLDPNECARKYGAHEFILNVNGNGIAGYHTGYGSVFGQAVGCRHSHLDNAGYSVDQKKEQLTPEQIVDMIVEEEEIRSVLCSMVICLFARKLYSLELLSKACKTLGWDVSENELKILGQKIYKEKLELKKSMGYSFASLTIPKRFLETESFRGFLDKDVFERMNSYFIAKMGL